MRQSRKAGLMPYGVCWSKYSIIGKNVLQYEADWGEWIPVSSGKSDTFSVTVYPDYTAVGSADTGYEMALVGTPITISVWSPGTGYLNGGGNELFRYFVRSDGVYSISYRTFQSVGEYVTSYEPIKYLGSVRAAKGSNPDANRGYTYVDPYDPDAYPDDYYDSTILIMRDTNGKYYRYYPYKPTHTVPTYTFSASIVDGVLMVTGDGTAGIVDGVLVTTGAGSPSVENNILYVR